MANTKIMRNQIADYLGILGNSTEVFEFMGTGFTSLDETVGAQTDSNTYIHDTTASSYIKGYETQFPFEAHMIKSEKAIMALYTVGRNHLVGSNAEFSYVRVDLFDPVADKENTFKARKFLTCAEISDSKGESASPMTTAGNLNAVGDPVLGTFCTKTKTFTADDEAVIS